MSIQDLFPYDQIDLNSFNIKTDSVCSFNILEKDIISSSTEISDNLKSNENVYCKRCGRLLKEGKSRLLGMGPTCYAQYRKERNQQINLFNMKGLR